MNRSIKIGSNVSLIFENLITEDSSISDENHLKATLALKFSEKEAETEKFRAISVFSLL